MVKKVVEVIAYEKLNNNDPLIRVRHTNPSFFRHEGVRTKFEAVYAPSFPKIEEAYEKQGKVVYRPGEEVIEKPPITLKTEVVNEPPSGLLIEETDNEGNVKETVPVVEEAEEEEEETDWREMKWLELRTFAKQFTDEKIENKEHAQEICEQAEKDGRI